MVSFVLFLMFILFIDSSLHNVKKSSVNFVYEQFYNDHHVCTCTEYIWQHFDILPWQQKRIENKDLNQNEYLYYSETPLVRPHLLRHKCGLS